MTNSESEENMNWLSSDHQVYRSKPFRRTSSTNTMDLINNSRTKPSSSSSSSSPSSSLCSACNAQICLSYFLSIFSSLIVVHGVWLWYTTALRVWLILPCTGVLLIFIGACLYSSGQSSLQRSRRRMSLRHKNRRFNRRNTQRQSFFESSNLSLNMLPQCFNQHQSNHRYLMLETLSSTLDNSTTPTTSSKQQGLLQATSSTNHDDDNATHQLPSTSNYVQDQRYMIEDDNAQQSNNITVQPPTYEQLFEETQWSFQTL